jgi:hypothetical protein
MKNYRKPFLLASAIGVICTFELQAGTLTVINKIPDQRVQLFIRGEGSHKHHTLLLEAGESKSYEINQRHTQGKHTFEVTASTGNGGDPDWKLMGGTASNLVTDADHTLVIDSTLGKISCTNVTKDNPPSLTK